MGKKPLTNEKLHGLSSPSYNDPGRPRPGPPLRKESTVVSQDGQQRRTRSRNRSGDSGYFEDISSENILNQDPGYDADVEVVRPYAIEEPDDDADQTSTSVSTQPATPRLLDSTEYWQKELVDSLRGLYCDSDSNDTPPLARYKRGRKRKSASLTGPPQGHHVKLPETAMQDVVMGREDPVYSPKRLRRKSGKMGDNGKIIYDSLSPENSGSTGTNSVVPSPDRSGPEPSELPAYVTSPGDQMDID